MNKILIFIISALCVCCSNINKKGEILIKKYLQENLNDFHTYQSIYFSSIDTLFREWTLPIDHLNDYNQLRFYISELTNLGYSDVNTGSDAGYYIKDLKTNPIYENEELKDKQPLWLEAWEKFKLYQDRIYNDMDSFSSEFIGLTIEHGFTINNKKEVIKFIFDKNLEEIIEVEYL